MADVAATSMPQVITDYPVPLLPITHVRSTLVTSSLASLRARNLLSRYDAAQRSPHREVILSCVAGQWLTIEVARAHYTACDELGLSTAEQIDIGTDVSKRIHDTFLRLVVQAVRGVGVTPWLVLQKGNGMISRLYRGGGIRVVQLARCCARVEVAQNPLLDIPYFANGTIGVYQAGVELLGDHVSVRVLRAESAQPGRLTVLRIEWS